MTGIFEAGKLEYYYLEDVVSTMYFDQAAPCRDHTGDLVWRSWKARLRQLLAG